MTHTCKRFLQCVFATLSVFGCNELWPSLIAAEPLQNTAPVAYGQRSGVSLNAPAKAITLRASDADGNPLSYIIVSGPSHGTLTQVDGALWQYTRNLNYQGRDSFRFKVNDGIADSNVASVRIVNAPHGIFQLTGGDPWQTNPNVDGLHLGVQWSKLATTEDPSGWDWSNIDSQLQNAVLYNKQIGLSLKILSDPPLWLLTNYGIPTYLVIKDDGIQINMVLPWDPIVEEKVNEFIFQLGHHISNDKSGNLPLDGTAAYVIMGGMGTQTETHMPGPTGTIPHIPDPNNPLQDISIAEELALWQAASKGFIATYAANFRTTPFILAGANPLEEDIPDSTVALTDVFCYGMGNSSPSCEGTPYQGFGALFGVMFWGLNENSSTDFIVNDWISTNSPTNSTGFQFGTSYGGTSDPSPVLDRAVSMNAHFVEVYADDADGRYAAKIHRYAPLLKW